ncbi:MAG: glycosyltransferase [Pseudomonadota bacterium]
MTINPLGMLRRAFGSNAGQQEAVRADDEARRPARMTVTSTSTGHIIDMPAGALPAQPWQSVALTAGRALLLRSTFDGAEPIEITLDWRLESVASPVELLGSVRFFDMAGKPIAPPYAGCRSSSLDPAFLQFKVGRGSQATRPATVTPPAQAQRMEIRWRGDAKSDGAALVSAPRIERVSMQVAPPPSQAAAPIAAAADTSAAVEAPARSAPDGSSRQRVGPSGWTRPDPMAVHGGVVLVWGARLEDEAQPHAKAVVASLSLIDEVGQPVSLSAAGASHSARYANFFYVRSFRPDTPGWHFRAFQVPQGAAAVQVDLFVENASPALRVVDAELVRLSPEQIERVIRAWPPQLSWIDPALHVARAAHRPDLVDDLLRLLTQVRQAHGDALTGWHGPIRVPVSAGATLVWRSRLEGDDTVSPKAALLTARAIGDAGLPSGARIAGLTDTERATERTHVTSFPRGAAGWFCRSFVVPEGVTEIELDLRRVAAPLSVEVVDAAALVMTRDAAAAMLAAGWEPDAAWLEPAVKAALAEGDTSLVRRLVSLREGLRYVGVTRPLGWRRPENLQVAPGAVVIWRARLEDDAAPQAKAAVMSIQPFDAAALPVAGKWHELAYSPRFHNYLYVPSHAPGEAGWQFKSFVVQPGVAELGVELHVHAGSPALRVCDADLTVLTLEAVAGMIEAWVPHEGWLEPALRLAQMEGALTLQERLARLLVQCQAVKPEAVRLWRAVSAELEELAPDWYPRIEARGRQLNRGERLTVCHLHKTAYPFENTGGAIRCLNTLKSQLEEGLDPFVVTPPGYPAYDGVATGDVPPLGQVAGCDHFRIGPNTNGIRTLSPPARVRIGAVQAAAIVAQRGASLVHAASGIRGYELALQAFALRDAFDIPVIYEVRSFHEHTWAPAGPRVFGMERTQLRIQKENRCMELADHVVTISESMRRILIQRGVPEDRIDVIPNGIDAEEFREAPPPVRIEALEGAELVVGYVSNMSRREGHRYLVEAVALARQGGLDCRCLFVGNGPERKALGELVAQLGLADVVHFAGEVDHHEVKSYYMAIDVFVVPRIPDYAADWVTPLKPYEAMALGRPLIVTDLPALREVVGEGERGMLVESANAESLADAIVRCAADRPSLEQTASRARQWVFEHRTWKANARRYIEIYEQVIARYRAARQRQRSRDERAG